MSRLMVTGMGFAFAMVLFAAPAAAQVSDGKCPDPLDLTDPDCPPPPPKKEVECSPGFWKTHLLDGPAAHNNLCTDLGIVGTGLACTGLANTTVCGGDNCSCAELVTILGTGGGGTAATNRQLAADCLNALSGLLGFDPNCDEEDVE
jgi:hypothetical protein